MHQPARKLTYCQVVRVTCEQVGTTDSSIWNTASHWVCGQGSVHPNERTLLRKQLWWFFFFFERQREKENAQYLAKNSTDFMPRSFLFWLTTPSSRNSGMRKACAGVPGLQAAVWLGQRLCHLPLLHLSSSRCNCGQQQHCEQRAGHLEHT